MDLRLQVNGEIVSIQRVCTPAGEQQLKKLIQDHVDLTGSKKGAAILQDWSSTLQQFWQLVPPSGPPLNKLLTLTASASAKPGDHRTMYGMPILHQCPGTKSE